MVKKMERELPGRQRHRAAPECMFICPPCTRPSRTAGIPVLYMFDGQNVFFDEDATYGKSWGVADYLDYTDTPLIVAAVECNAGANNERLVEYSPYRFDDPTYGHFDGKGQATMSWYHPPVQTLHRPQLPAPCPTGSTPSSAAAAWAA